MKLIKNLVIGLILVLSLYFMEVKAVTITGDFPSSLSTVQEGAKLEYHATWFHYKYNDDYAIICTEINNENTPVGHTCSLNSDWSTETRVGVAAIIEAANLPAGNAANETDRENYYYAQTTINRFIYNQTGNSINLVNSDYTSTSFLNAANAAVSAYNATFTVSLSKTNITLTESGNYYISPIITVSATNLYDYTVSVSGDMEVYDKSGNSFKVRVSKENVESGSTGPFTITVTGRKRYFQARNYDCGSSVQTVTPNIVKAYYINKNVTATAAVSTGTIAVTKKDESGANLAGAILRLYKGDELIEQWTSTTSAHQITDLIVDNDYRIVEVTAPAGYIKASDVNNIAVTKDTTTTVNITNNSIEITINKTDTKNQGQIITVGTAQFKLYYLDDNSQEVATTISTTNGTVKVTSSSSFRLIAGKTYYLQELSAPAGYVLNTAIVSFTMQANDTQIVAFGNFPTKLIINKYVKDTTTRVKNVKISVCRYNDETEVYDICNSYTTDENALVINSLPLGKYVIKETEAPAGYILDAKEYSLEITEENNEQTVTLYNEEKVEEIPKTGINIWLLTGSSILLTGVGSFLYIKTRKKFI